MSNEYELARDSRQDLIFTKEQLLAPLLPGMERPPHPMWLGELGEGLLPGRADQPGHVGRCRARTSSLDDEAAAERAGDARADGRSARRRRSPEDA